jgi:hypothetical protein
MALWQEQIAAVVTARRDEIESDLVLARIERDRATNNLQEAESRVAFFEHMVSLAGGEGAAAEAPAEKLTLHEAMRRVLATAPQRMMRAADLAESINRQRLYRMQDGRPVEKQQVHARVGHYPELFDREGTFIKLV